ncbi:hypothetical protein GGI03_004325, partial [Coemansia sp. RSA 2337]
MTRKLQNAADNSWSKSPLAYIVQFFIPQIRQCTAALRLKWIPGHKGNKGNKAADKAAKEAQQQRQGWWTFRLGAPPERPFWVCAGTSLAPYKIGGIVKQQEEVWAAERLVKWVCLANGNAEICESDLKEMLEALNWSANPNGTWMCKNSWCHTNARDSNLCRFMLGMMFKVLPVAEHEWAWYLQAYEESEWKMCLHCNTAEVIVQEMAQYGKKGRDWASHSLASNKELKSVVQWQRILRKVAIHERWAHEYQEHWLPQNDAQISKEEALMIRPKKRRALMCQPRPPDVECNDGTPVYPKETEARRLAKYKKLCQ